MPSPRKPEEHADFISRSWLSRVLVRGRRDGFGDLVDWLNAEPCGLMWPGDKVWEGTFIMLEPGAITEHYRRFHGPVPRSIARLMKASADEYMPRMGF